MASPMNFAQPKKASAPE